MVRTRATWPVEVALAVGTVALGMVCLVGCTSTTPRTEVFVVVDTDLRGPSGIDNLYVEVTSPGGDVQTSTAQLGAGEAPLPRSIGLVWTTGPLGPFTVRVVGNTGGSQRVERSARFEFQRDRTLVLPMNLLGACERTRCGATETCGEMGCRAVDVAAAELLAYDGTLPRLDGSTPTDDAGARDDAGSHDATTADASTDAAVAVVDGCVAAAEVCNMRDDDCDGLSDEDFTLATDMLNCGTCGHACAFANATGACVGGACVISACSAGFQDCNGTGDDGCEIDTATDAAHCGACAMACTAPPNRMCCASVCAMRCP